MSTDGTVLADDLTGATDTVVKFAAAGWDATLSTSPYARRRETDGHHAHARTLDSRALSTDEARRVTAAAIVAAGDDQVYLKIDSTMRGAVAGQLAGALEGRRRSHDDAVVVLCPAYPAMGRTVRQGRVLVHGASVVQSPAGTDPVTPVRTDRLEELVPGLVSVPNAGDPATLSRAIVTAGRARGLVGVDADDEADLERIAAAVVLLGTAALPAGSAGLAAPLAEGWLDESVEPAAALPAAGPGAILVVVSSLHQVARSQVAHLREARDDTEAMAPQWSDLDSPEAIESWASGLPSEAAAAGVVVVTTPEQPPAAGNEGRFGATALADTAAVLLRRMDFGALVLVGGDGAAAVLDRLGADGIAVAGTITEGVPVGTLLGGPNAGLVVVTKAGGFGDSTTLAVIITTLKENQS